MDEILEIISVLKSKTPVFCEDLDTARPLKSFLMNHNKADILVRKHFPQNMAVMQDFQNLRLCYGFLMKGQVLQLSYINTEQAGRGRYTIIFNRIRKFIIKTLGVDIRVDMAAFNQELTPYSIAVSHVYRMSLILVNEAQLTDYYIQYDNNELVAYFLK